MFQHFAELPHSLQVVDSLRFDGDMLLDINNRFGLLECGLKPRKEGSSFHLLAPDSTPSNHPFNRRGGAKVNGESEVDFFTGPGGR